MINYNGLSKMKDVKDSVSIRNISSKVSLCNLICNNSYKLEDDVY